MKKIFSNPTFLAVSLLVILLFGISGYYFELGWPAWLTALVAIIIGVCILIIIKLVASWLAPWLKRIPIGIITTIASGFIALFLMRMFAFRWPSSLFYTLAAFGFLCCLLLIIGLKRIMCDGEKKTGAIMVAVAIVLAVSGLYGFNSLDGDPYLKESRTTNEKTDTATLAEMGIQDPSKSGSFKVETFTYGSGTDKKRPEYREGVQITTPTVDASLMLPEWKGKKKKWREKFWGFGVENFPLNGRVYMPKGEGPFPLVMMVHGNHSMIDYSDAGYAYLGEMLASQGVIAVSVDENFINAHWSGDFRGKEMPTRGWLLLKHLEQWKKWNSGNPDLKGKVDMDNIILMGHSRGGEAVSIAAVFNKLNRFPDNAKEEFNFGFGIKGIVTVAPTDYRYDREMDLENINYLSLQGAYDSDETSFWGMRPFHRLKFTGDFNGFKAGLYMNHANHGQFNSTWGRSDFGAPMKWLLNLKPLVSGEEQRQVAKVYIAAFVDVVLKGNKDYVPIFQNVTLANDWLPKEEYLSQYSDTYKEILLDFEEDLDVTSGTDGVYINAKNFKVWREEQLKARDGGSQQNNALVLGWKYDGGINLDSLAQYQIDFGEKTVDLSSMDTFALSLALGNVSELKDDKEKKEKISSGYNFSIVLKDSLGNTTSVDLSSINQPPKQLKSRFTKFKFLDKEMMGEESEIQLSSCYVPMSSFVEQNDSLQLNKMKSIHLVFDKDSLGVIVLDDIGFFKKM